METLTQELLNEKYIPGNLYFSKRQYSIWFSNIPKSNSKHIGVLSANSPFMVLEIALHFSKGNFSLKICQDNLIGWIDFYTVAGSFNPLTEFQPWKP